MEHIICFGDSLTQQGYFSGWLSHLADHYVRKAHVINCGLSGYNSRWYLDLLTDKERLACILPESARKPLFVTLLLGSNDLATNDQGVPLGEFIANMESILKFIHKEVRPKYGIFLMTPPPVNDEARRNFANLAETDRTLANTRLYRAAVLDVAAKAHKEHPEMNVHLVDTHTAILQHACPAVSAAAVDPKWQPQNNPRAVWTRLLVDGLHINDVGGDVFFSALLDAIEESAFAEHLNPENMKWPAPEFTVLMEQEIRSRKAGAEEEA